MRFPSILLILFGIAFGFSQSKISGTVYDKKTKKPIAFADILAGSNYEFYTSTNTDGTFYLEVDSLTTFFEVQVDTYDTQRVDIKPGANYNLKIFMEKNAENLEEVVIITKLKKYKNKKENPAYAILKKLWERKRKNGLNNFDNYAYEEYEKIQFDLNNIDSAFMKKKIFRKFEFIFNNVDTSRINGKAYLPMFINESIYRVIGQNKPTKRERRDLIANKSSGFDDNEIVGQTVKNLYKDFDIYENRLNFFNKGFISPVARDGFAHYEYNLIDTIVVDSVKCYRLKYFPKRPGELTFKGDIFISTDYYAVKEVTMSTTKGINVNFVRDIYVELKYNNLNDSIFLPDQSYILLDMSLINKKNESKGMFAHRTISYKDYVYNQTLPEDTFTKIWDPYDEGAFEKPIDFWKERRHYTLKQDEAAIYATLDSLQKVPKFKRIVNIVESVASGYFNVGNVFDIGNIYSSFGYNIVEGTRLRFGGRTYFSRNDMWRFAFYTAYGFNDDKFKYGAEFRYMFDKHNRFTLGIGTKRDIEQLGVQLTTDDGILTRSFASSAIFARGDNSLLSNLRLTNAFASIQPWKNVEFRLDATYQNIKSAFDQFSIGFIKDGNVFNEVRDAHLTLSIGARPGAKYSRYGLDRYEHTTLAPTILLKYVKGLNGVMGSDFNYDKLQLYYFHPLLLGSIGRADITFEAGKIFQALPISLLSVIPANQSFGLIPSTFSQLNYYEFITDTYASLIIEHHFNGRIFGYIPLIKKLKLREVAFIRTAWGRISDYAQAINASSIIYDAPDTDLYYEYGFGIENIGLGNWRIFRVDFNWRGNYLDKPNIQKFGVKFGFQLTF